MTVVVALTDDTIGLIVEVVIVIGIAFVFLHHAYRMYRGTEARLRSLVGWSVLYAVLASTTIFSTLVPVPSADHAAVFFAGLLDAAFAILAGLWTYWNVERTTTFEWRPPGRLYYRMKPFIPVLYAVLFTLEISIELAALGFQVPDEGSSPDVLPVVWEVILRVGDLVLSIAAGIVIGASVAIYAELRRRRAKEAAIVLGEPPTDTVRSAN